jgi:hypothetical protein
MESQIHGAQSIAPRADVSTRVSGDLSGLYAKLTNYAFDEVDQ